MRIEKKNYPQAYLEECKYKIKKKKMPKSIDVELELDSGSDSEWLYLSAYWGTFLNLWTPNTRSR